MARPRKEASEKQGRRGRGQGSIAWREDRQKFQVSRSIDGKRKYEYVDTKKEAESVLKKWDREVEQGLKFDRRIFTVEEYLAYWLEVKHPTVELLFDTYLGRCGNQLVKKENVAKICVKDMRVEITEFDGSPALSVNQRNALARALPFERNTSFPVHQRL